MGGWVIAGVFGVIGIFNRQARERRKEDESVATNLINNLQKTVDLQEDTMKKMRLEMDAHTKERNEEIKGIRDQMSHLQGRNAVLEELFKGRDPAMQAFLKDAPMLLEITKKDHELIEESMKSITGLSATMSKFVETCEALLAKG